MRLAHCCIVIAFLLAAPARAEIAADAVKRYEAAGAEITYAFLSGSLSGEVPTLQNPRYAPALRMLGDASIFMQPLTHKDWDALTRVMNVTGDIFDRYSRSTAAGGASPPPDRAKLLAMSEVAGLLLAFTMHTAAAGGDIFNDVFVLNPEKLPADRLSRMPELVNVVMMRAIRTAAQFASGPLSEELRRSVVSALDAAMPRMARTLPPAQRKEAAALLSAAAEKAPDQRAAIATILAKLRDAPCDALCKAQ